jgi:hypothetical protein
LPLLVALAQRHASTPRVIHRLLGRGKRGQPLLDRLIRVRVGAATPLSLLEPVALTRFRARAGRARTGRG